MNGQCFTGSGKSKKLAKHSAAEAALKSFVQYRNASEVAQALGIGSGGNQDFTTDISETNFTGGELQDKMASNVSHNLFDFDFYLVFLFNSFWLYIFIYEV